MEVMRVIALLLLLAVALAQVDPEVNISSLNSTAAHEQSAVDLSLLSTDPANANRISYSGYVQVDPTLTNSHEANYFFWFFEALNSSKSGTDIPIIMWLQGGPGCSSLLGLFFENGPFRVVGDLSLPLDQQLSTNAFAWTNEFHMIFVDNPIGSGFSYGSPAVYIRNETQMATYLENVLSQFMTKFPEYGTNPFYVFGESYAGKYVPSLSSYIQQKKPASIVNLQGFGVGDGYTNPFVQVTAHADMAFNAGLVDEIQAEDIRKYAALCRSHILAEQWEPAFQARQEIFNIIESSSGNVNIYDYRTYTPYNYTPIIEYVNQQSVKNALHVGTHGFTEMCSSFVKDFMTEDSMKSVADVIPALLDQYPALFYQGQFDARDGVAMVEAMLRNLDWSGVPGYLTAPRSVWTVNGTVGGMTRTYRNLSQCVVVGAGHLVPMNQPAASLEMVRRFVYQLSWSG